MRSLKNISIGVLCLSFLSSCNSPKKETTSDLNNYLDALVKPIMEKNEIPGLSLAITVDGKHRFFNYGLASKADQIEVTNTTLFELGSVSKTFTATLASLSQINGTLNLSDPVSKYMPELKNTAFDQIKLYNLGTHTAGGFTLQLPEEIKNNEQLIHYYKTWKPDYSASTQRIYTNPSIGLLGVIAGKTFQQPFTKAMTENVFSKMGLNNTFYEVPAANVGQYAFGYNKNDEPIRVTPGVLANEAYGVKSCTQDMITFVDANMGIGNIDSKLSAAIINTHTGYFNTSEMTQDLIWEQYHYPVTLEQLQKGNSADMAFKPNPVKEILPHQKPITDVLINKTGATNGFGAYVMYVPSKKIGIVILANKNYPNSERIDIAYKLLSYLEKSEKL
ncbi:class C beta-lactamase [Chryseobacterium jejuense]|uniref:Beta-lactamase n=1 Tax=Chryseobacterium jejuense TaxID=445960 RepID=A0A2X2VKY4_CHRJE|nr:class C beta-lactamase [Chryseobacterium jejuense]SDI89147.1 beta-lactamase class C [Chryseobacterium jejuense]SQB27487.1 Beta-lactamase [Chryseobacterium jejuense]